VPSNEKTPLLMLGAAVTITGSCLIEVGKSPGCRRLRIFPGPKTCGSAIVDRWSSTPLKWINNKVDSTLSFRRSSRDGAAFEEIAMVGADHRPLAVLTADVIQRDLLSHTDYEGVRLVDFVHGVATVERDANR
jgi:hypothetical protein